MWVFRFTLLATVACAAAPKPLQFTPDQIFQSLRTAKPPMPPADCAALELSACRLDVRKPVRGDLSLRWVQLDDDPELEAVLVAGDELTTYFAFIFDWNRTWNLAGHIMCYRHCEDANFITIQRLTENSPVFVIAHQDFSGSGPGLTGYPGVFLRQGRVESGFEFITEVINRLLDPSNHFLRLRQSGRYLVQHTIHESPPGQNPTHTCNVQTWSAEKQKFIDVPAQKPNFCDAKSGRPLPDKSFATGLTTDTY